MSFFHRLFKLRIFKFRTTLSEELEDLHTETIHLQQTLTHSRLLQRQWTKLFAVYAVLAYLALNLAFYTFFLPEDYVARTYAVMTTIVIGALLYGLHWLIRWYFRTMITMREDRIILFRDRKQELIEEVKKKETYTVAKALLEKYGETITPEVRSPTPTDNTNKDLRQRVSIKPGAPNSDKPMVSVRTSPSNIGQLETVNPASPPVLARDASNGPPAGVVPGKLPRAILPPQRTFWGVILDTIVGDGPSKRYALICKSCNSHNGMALEEEFEYISFRCAYCNYFNSARKQKPVFHGDAVVHDPAPTTNQSQSARVEPSTPSSAESGPETEAPASSSIPHRPLRDSDQSANESRSRSRSRSNSVEHAGPADATLSSFEDDQA